MDIQYNISLNMYINFFFRFLLLIFLELISETVTCGKLLSAPLVGDSKTSIKIKERKMLLRLKSKTEISFIIHTFAGK